MFWLPRECDQLKLKFSRKGENDNNNPGPLKSRPRALFIVPEDYESLCRKGLDASMMLRDENGFFERLVTVHVLSRQTRKLELPGNNTLYEVGLDFFPGLSRSRLLRWLLAPVHFFRTLRLILNLIAQEDIDFVRANDPFWSGLLGLFSSRLARVPLCVSIHADYEKCYQLRGAGDSYTLFGWRWPAEWVCRRVLASADLVLPIRKSLVKWAVDRGANPARVRIIPHGIDMEPFCHLPEEDVRAQLAVPDWVPIISFAGRLSKENYIYDVLEAASRLVGMGYDFRLVIAGSGAEEAEVKRRVESDKELSRVLIFTGSLPRLTVLELRRSSRVSVCLMGGFSLIEACAAGSPVVAYDVEWHSELVRSGETGYLLPEGDIDGLAEALAKLLSDRDLARCMGMAGRRIAMARHNLSVASRAKCSCYEELVAQKIK